MGGDKVLRCHHLIYLLVQTALETKVTVGDNAHEVVVVVNNGNTTNVIVVHHVQSILNSTSELYCHRVVDHSVLSPLDNGNIACLFLDGHVLVYHADTSLTGYGNGH